MLQVLLIAAAVILAIALFGAFLFHLVPYLKNTVYTNPAPVYQTASAGVASSGDDTITEEDYGKTFVYPIGTRFSVALDAAKYGSGAFSCTRDGVIVSLGAVSGAPTAQNATRFETRRSGDCVYSSRSFLMTVHVDEPPKSHTP
ncbi:hypothetical protein KW797_01305 [Candidatus Parcubacteria bacterium]|nr:hypothetical protein [Candidatus Parcubacteria bacterium]